MEGRKVQADERRETPLPEAKCPPGFDPRSMGSTLAQSTAKGGRLRHSGAQHLRPRMRWKTSGKDFQTGGDDGHNADTVLSLMHEFSKIIADTSQTMCCEGTHRMDL